MSAFFRVAVVIVVGILGAGLPSNLNAQMVVDENGGWVNYQIVPRTVYEKRPVKCTRWIDETVSEKQQVTSYKPVWNTERRIRKQTVLKPVTETRLRTETTYAYKPVQETKYRERTVEETRYESETVMREEEYTVRKPVVVSELRDQNITVRQKVTEDMVEVQHLVDYQPSPDCPEELVPIYTQRRRPVKVTRYVDKVETRKVPVDVEKYIQETSTRKVPVTVTKPVTQVRTEKIPYTETRYQRQAITREVPIQETTYRQVEVETPYEVEVCRWETVTKEVSIPKVVRRRVDYEVMEEVPRTVWMKIPVDDCGQPIGPATRIDSDASSDWNSVYEPTPTTTSGFGSTLARKPLDSDPPSRLIDETSQSGSDADASDADASDADAAEPRYRGRWDQLKIRDETAAKAGSILVPETKDQLQRSSNLKPIVTGNDASDVGSDSGSSVQNLSAITSLRVGTPTLPKAATPEADPAETGDEFAADRRRSATTNPPAGDANAGSESANRRQPESGAAPALSSPD